MTREIERDREEREKGKKRTGEKTKGGAHATLRRPTGDAERRLFSRDPRPLLLLFFFAQGYTTDMPVSFE